MFTKSFSSRVIIFFSSIFLMISTLEAGGWGKTGEVVEYDGVKWNGVYFDMGGLNFTASIPNYSGARLQNDTASINGSYKDLIYIITTPYDTYYTFPDTVKEFADVVQEINTDHIVMIVNTPIGSKYAIDLIPNNPEEIFWRFIATEDHLIKMGTDDADENRRLYFYESIIFQ